MATLLRRLGGGPGGPGGSLLRGAAGAPGAALARAMSVLKSQSVKAFIDARGREEPTKWRPYKELDGPWRGPQMKARERALVVKEAIKAGEVKLEPTRLPPPPHFKGHKRERERPIALESIAAKMADMPRMIAEYRQARRERREKWRAANRWK